MKRLGMEWLAPPQEPKIYEPNHGHDLPDQTPVARLNAANVRGVGSLDRVGVDYLLGWLQSATEMGHIPVDLWNKGVDTASRFERDEKRRQS